MILASCDITDVSELNNNEKEPEDVPAEPLFTNAQFTLGSFIHNTNVNINIFKLISQQWTTTTYTAEPRYEVDTRTIPSNVWTILYRDVLNDLQTARVKIQENELLTEGERQNKLASVEVLRTLTYYQLLTIFGSIPYTEALNPEITQPVYDDAETIYLALMDSLNTAISSFDPASPGFGTADIYYGGSDAPIENWISFANSLKMRLAITIADVNPQVAGQAIVEAAPNAISSNAQNAMIPFTSAPPTTNPVWESLVQSDRDDYIPAAPFVDRMNALNDPRRPIIYTQLQGQYVGGIYGEVNDYPQFSHFSELIEQPDRPGMIMGYSEVEFILAEAAARGFIPGGAAEAALHYNAAIRADMEFWGVPDAEITAYLAQPGVAYATAGGTFQERIGVQKWFALHLQGLQAWTEYRRLDYPVLAAPPAAAIDIVPTRYTYPIDEQNFNVNNYQQAVQMLGGPDELTTLLFWDVNPPN
jgi:hypothetical protein